MLELINCFFDFVIEGDGFFGLEMDVGIEYIWDGCFYVDNIGQLVSVDGLFVLDVDMCVLIIFDFNVQNVCIIDGGVVIEDGVQVGWIGVFDIVDCGVFFKEGNGCYILEFGLEEVEFLVMFDVVVCQGYVEGLNVFFIVELIDMMQIMCVYVLVLKFLKDVEELNCSVIECFGKV